jgi:hypothetical protein
MKGFLQIRVVFLLNESFLLGAFPLKADICPLEAFTVAIDKLRLPEVRWIGIQVQVV